MNIRDIKYLLCDLDGTLLHFDLDSFIKGYLALIQPHFKQYPWQDQVANWILTGTDLMLNNDGTKTNQSVFLEYFSTRSGLSKQEIWQHFLDFYENKFDELKTISQQDQKAINTIEKASLHGYQLVLATQPIFPELAIRKRLSWAGLNHIKFKLITHIENISSCKPSPLYFRQILNLLQAQPRDCMMIGNDPVADMAAARINIHTFFITTLNDNPVPEEADYAGDFSDLTQLLKLK